MSPDDAKAVPNILFVDDEENVLRSMKRLFLDEPCEIFTAPSGKAALRILETYDCAVVVSDERMPEMSGSEFLGIVRKMQPDSMRIVLTGYADVQAAIRAINEGGAYRYMTKPWNDMDLILLVRDAIGTYKLKKQNKQLTELTQRQNEELKNWNTQLEAMVQEQTLDIQNKNGELQKINEQLNRNFKNSIEAFSGLIEMRQKSVSNHAKNVAALALQTASSMRMSEEETSSIFVAGLLHDIGKIGIPDAILLKQPEEMNDTEFAEYRRHPVRGQVAVEAIDGFHDIGVMIRHHHECVDGSGYPEGLKRGSIPMGSRIIAVADAVDQFAAREAFSAEGFLRAVKNIEFYIDTKYDRKVLEHLSPIIHKKVDEIGGRGATKENEVEIHPSRLAPGMVLTRDVRSGTGLLVLARGATFDRKTIDSLERYYSIDAPATGVFVRKKDAGVQR